MGWQKKQNIAAIRVDSSEEMGSGHLMRCLTLAETLRREGWQVHFICRDLLGNLMHLIKEKGFFLHVLSCKQTHASLSDYEAWLTVPVEEDAQETTDILREMAVTVGEVSRLIIDHYAIDVRWETIVRPFVREIFVIDDLANRVHDCDYLLDQTFSKNMMHRYDGLVPKQCQLFLGPKYVLLRPEFYEARKSLRERDGTLRRILVFYGGSDSTGETEKAMRALFLLNLKDVVIDVVVGGSNTRKAEIKKRCETHPSFRYHCQVNYMAELMARADLALGAGGTATWERCFLGLPAIVTAIAENQLPACHSCAEAGLIYYAGTWREVSSTDIGIFVLKYTDQRALKAFQTACWLENAFGAVKKRKMGGKHGQGLCCGDGKGTAFLSYSNVEKG